MYRLERVMNMSAIDRAREKLQEFELHLWAQNISNGSQVIGTGVIYQRSGYGLMTPTPCIPNINRSLNWKLVNISKKILKFILLCQCDKIFSKFSWNFFIARERGEFFFIFENFMLKMVFLNIFRPIFHDISTRY